MATRHRPGAFASDRISHQHFLARNFRAAPAHETFDGIDRFRRLEDAHAIGLVADDGSGVHCPENGPPTASSRRPSASAMT